MCYTALHVCKGVGAKRAILELHGDHSPNHDEIAPLMTTKYEMMWIVSCCIRFLLMMLPRLWDRIRESSKVTVRNRRKEVLVPLLLNEAGVS